MRRRIGMSVLSVLIFSACSTNEPQELQNETMALTAKVEGSKVNRVIDIGANYTTSLDVAFARLDQNPSSGLYPCTYDDVNSALFATRDGGTDATKLYFDEPQYYQSPGQHDDTRLIGWFPALSPKAGVLTFDISDGATDVMLTQELVGNTTQKIGTNDNPFFFRHQLCQLVVKVIATSQETVARWGTVRSVVVKKLPTSYLITLPGGTRASGLADILLNERGSAKKMSPVRLSSTGFAECGYLLTAPIANSLTLELTGGNGERLILEAALPVGESFCSGSIYELKINLDGQHDAAFNFSDAIRWEEAVDLDVEF